MRSASSVVLLLVGIALLINFVQGGPERATRWTVRTLTGKDLKGPNQ